MILSHNEIESNEYHEKSSRLGRRKQYAGKTGLQECLIKRLRQQRDGCIVMMRAMCFETDFD
jgi:hypothetical protein